MYCAANNVATFVGATDGTNTIADNDSVTEVIAVLADADLIETVTMNTPGSWTYDAASNSVVTP